MRPPRLVEFVDAGYPPEALAARREGRVVLRLTIDVEGRVTQAEVVGAAGEGFDEPARQASLRFRFEPALRGGAPVASRILYTYEFRLPPPEAGAAPGPEAGSSSGPEAGATPGPERSGAGAVAGPNAGGGPFRSPEPAPAAREVTVHGVTPAERLRQSAQAVTVVETEQAKRQTADLGEVLARVGGVGVRRSGGLGSDTQFSLNGLTGDQIRFFLDGVPLDVAGYPFGIANVPVNLVERVEIYRGVVPIRFGADALGGAVNLVTDQRVRGTGASASYQVGSYDTYRYTVGARHLHEPSGFFTRVNGFFDDARNDYPMHLDEVPGEGGRVGPARVHRFHDAYRAWGGGVEAGFVDRPWARRLLARAFVTDYDKQWQHGVRPRGAPYGEVTSGESTAGATLRYEHVLGRGVSLQAVAGYAYGRATFVDVSECLYDWYGRCRRPTNPRQGERNPGNADDQVFWKHTGFGRAQLGWQFSPEQAVRVSVSPTLVTRSGDERRQRPEDRDPLTSGRHLFTLVNGVEHELDLFEGRLENIAFAKQYLQTARSEEPSYGGAPPVRRERDTLRFGLGDGLRYRVARWLYAKGSYEWATRLPRPDEVFGDAAFVVQSLDLKPETSHNLNAGLAAEARPAGAGAVRLEVNGFLRDVDNLIMLLVQSNFRASKYENVYSARSLGLETNLGWVSPGEYVALDGNVTYQDFRNTATEGTYRDNEGERVPNRPYLFANGSARLQFRGVVGPDGDVALAWHTRYVHEFFLAWEGAGLAGSKDVVGSQLLHSLALTCLARGRATASSTIEVQNLTDARAFDFFGVPKPGRTFFFKATLEI
ncbi:MAG TPA: TonB-dependent siderophore myxochelin receptor MxcH [Polyangiaceae bacterium]|nr:TonB-dependent siderophore myxochelin receptor MxcH [Polyangiaceae bacterium]